MGSKRIEGKRATEAVLCLLRREATAAEIARRFSMAEGTLYRLRDRFLEAGKGGLCCGNAKSGADQRVAELQKEIAERDRVIGEMTIANRILKKTADGLL